MVVLRMAAMKAVKRQMEGCLGSALSGGKIPGRGGNGLDDEGKQQMGMKPGSSKLGVFGGQIGEIEDRLHPLECEFDLPTRGIELLQGCSWNCGFRQ